MHLLERDPIKKRKGGRGKVEEGEGNRRVKLKKETVIGRKTLKIKALKRGKDEGH